MLRISNLHVEVEGKEILKGFSLAIRSGEIHALMGPNGSGKSTLAFALMGHPLYKCKGQNAKGKVLLDGRNIIERKPDERARMGLFLAFQSPLAIQGVSVASFLRTAYKSVKRNSRNIQVAEFDQILIKKAQRLGLSRSFLRRSLNDGFSGGEKKKAEMLQALILKPKYAIFDEIDTGLDIDALKTVAKGINFLVKQKTGVLLITHYRRILHHLRPDYVHILIKGRLVKSGDYKLAIEIEKEGYKTIKAKVKSQKSKPPRKTKKSNH